MRLTDLHETLDPFLPAASCQFQYGDCGIEVYGVVQRALAAGVGDFRVVEGMVQVAGDPGPTAHTWIERRGRIYDPTQNQFSGRSVRYSPPGEYRRVYIPQDFLDDWIEQYGEPPTAGV